MKYFFDTEFNEDGKTIDLISIGIVALDGRSLYRCNENARLDLCNDWVRQNVLPQLPAYGEKDADGSSIWCPHKTIHAGILRLLAGDSKPEFWSYYADYDWVALCQLYGSMSSLPSHFPMWCRDIKQLSESLGNPQHPKQKKGAHDALEDARYHRDLYLWLTGEGSASSWGKSFER